MYKTILMSTAACLLATSVHALDFNPYVSAKVSYSDTNNRIRTTDQFDDGMAKQKSRADDHTRGGHFALGVASENLRAEAEINLYNKAKNKSIDEDGDYSKVAFSRNSLMFNAYYDFHNKTAFTPYIGAGLGWAHLKMVAKDENNRKDRSANHLAWQVGAGVGYEIAQNLSLDLGYRYMDSGALTVKNRDEAAEGDMILSKDRVRTYSHEIQLGLRYMF